MTTLYATATYVNAADPIPDSEKPTEIVDPGRRPCLVPRLAGKELSGAKTALAAANCKLGKVRRPDRPHGKRRWALVVKSSTPKAGASPADGTVDHRLGPKPRRAR